LAYYYEESIQKFIGLSTDIKPTVTGNGAAIPVGSEFYATDSKHTYIFDGSNWYTKIYSTYLQDQKTFALEHYLSIVIENVIIQSNVIIGAKTFYLNAGAAAAIGQVLEIRYANPNDPFARGRFYQAEIVTVNVSSTQVEIICDMPIDFNLDINYIETAALSNINMNVAGTSTAPIIFFSRPPTTSIWEITSIIVTGIMTGQPDDSKFFDQAKLIWGIFFGFESPILNLRKYLVNIQDNAGFRGTAYEVTYTTRTLPLGSYGLSARKIIAGQDHYGTILRLTGITQDRFAVYIQDDLTGITRWRIRVMGHEVDE